MFPAIFQKRQVLSRRRSPRIVRPTPPLSPRAHSKSIRRRFKGAPSVTFRKHKAARDKINDACEGSVRDYSMRSHRFSAQHRRKRRWKHLIWMHLYGIHLRQPCEKRFRRMAEEDKMYLVSMHVHFYIQQTAKKRVSRWFGLWSSRLYYS